MARSQKTAVLIHYASPYYDPQKAHEYYMRTRELKGRRSASKLNDDGKEIWNYTKDSIKNEKSSVTKNNQEEYKRNITQIRAKAKKTRTQISIKLKKLNEYLTQKASNEKKQIQNNKNSALKKIDDNSENQKKSIEKKRDSEIDRLLSIEIPKNLSKEEQERRIAERDKKIAELRNEAKSDKYKTDSKAKTDKVQIKNDATGKASTLTKQLANQKSQNTANATAEKAKVSAELKTAVEAARKAYIAKKKDTTAKYEEVYQTEFDKIASQYGATEKKSKSHHPLSYYIKK